MEYLGLETHVRSYQGVLFRDLQYNLKDTTLKRRVFWTLQQAERTFRKAYMMGC